MAAGCAVQAPEPSLLAGFAECTPALFMAPQPGTKVVTRDITHAAGVPLAGYAQDITDSAGRVTTAKVTVDRAAWRGHCSSLRYSAEIDGKTIQSPTVEAFAASGLQDVIAFTADGLGGAVVRARSAVAGEGISDPEFDYNEKGKRAMARQTVAFGKTRYEIVYSAQTYDEAGRLRSYVAEIRPAR